MTRRPATILQADVARTIRAAKHRVAIFVHGCFWHGHNCSKGRLPKTRLDFWGPKIQHNQRRDAESVRALEADGWRVLTIWQCETKDAADLKQRLTKFFARRRRATALPLQTLMK